jgi:hypothetical protein
MNKLLRSLPLIGLAAALSLTLSFFALLVVYLLYGISAGDIGCQLPNLWQSCANDLGWGLLLFGPFAALGGLFIGTPLTFWLLHHVNQRALEWLKQLFLPVYALSDIAGALPTAITLFIHAIYLSTRNGNGSTQADAAMRTVLPPMQMAMALMLLVFPGYLPFGFIGRLWAAIIILQPVFSGHHHDDSNTR